ncbi:zinc finger BED domain-containing protein RICESLEEPER 4-like isoform X2 [Mangifera indica]|uniref:zinc finger BED domain-containing protein RICESLEEPER 4-like isoform X2 n=1 Tax=Mangifera indica TaxID=29780 RepID=UPI001CFB7619|nr:zinc finger BED domain-containing protein RICESLEEPER 4-like isoform X2 [Mangifera indica]
MPFIFVPSQNDKVFYFIISLENGKDVESLVQRGEPFVSSNLNGINLHHGQEITQIREQNAYFEPTLNKESEMAMNTSMESSSSIKRRKLKSKVWEDFIKYEDKEKKEWAKCKHCEKVFVGSSKSGTTHLNNHLKSCQGLRTLGGVADKGKMKSVIGPNLNGSELVSRIIKYGLNDIKDDILVIYEQKKCNFHGYLDKLPSHFSVTIEWWDAFWYLRIWFVDDSWELRNMIINFNNRGDVYELVKSVLMDWNIHRKICSVIISCHHPLIYVEQNENLKNWLKEQGSVPFIVASYLHEFAFSEIQANLSFHKLKEISPNKILTKASDLQSYVSKSSNDLSFNNAVTEATSKGKIVTSQSVPQTSCQDESLFEWVVGCKEVFCELEHRYPDFKSMNFTKEEWDDATLMYGCWQVMKDLKKEIDSLLDASKTVNVYFSIFCYFFLRFDQLRKSDNSYLHTIASCCLEHVECWEYCGLVKEVIILDPRCKRETLESYYKMIYGNDAEACFDKMIDDVKNFFSNCVKGISSSCSSHDYNTTLESELDSYLKEKHPEDEGLDVLQWWHDKSLIYPTLARIACYFLSISIKTPDLDLDDSLRGEIDDILLGSLDDDLKYKLACTKIWLNTSENN